MIERQNAIRGGMGPAAARAFMRNEVRELQLQAHRAIDWWYEVSKRHPGRDKMFERFAKLDCAEVDASIAVATGWLKRHVND